MSKKILVFADGTGNESGLLFDERRTNVYKLYRATRNGPDTKIDPADQIAIYHRGVGTLGSPTASRLQKLRVEILQAAVGRGLTDQIIACYASIINTWRPGDSIYLFGFSRGAYCVRCVAHILELIGIPTTEADGSPLNYDPVALKTTSTEAVKILYRLGLPQPNIDLRLKKLEAFRAARSCRIEPAIGTLPFFIGVWDSVAAIGWLHFASSKFFRWLAAHRPFNRFLSDKYDMHFPPDIPFARHAMAIDEYRKDFSRVIWGGSSTPDEQVGGYDRFLQEWFAGCHSDIGGSYPESESRLSDITLKWMRDFVVDHLPDASTRIQINDDLLQLFPSPDGMMHDELMAGHGSQVYGKAVNRRVDPKGKLHSSVIERLKLPAVRNFTSFSAYRPIALSDHPQAAQFYQSTVTPSSTSDDVSTRSGPQE